MPNIHYDESNLPSESHRRELKSGVTDKELCEAYTQLQSIRKVADKFGITFETVRRRINRHRIDPAVKNAMKEIGAEQEPNVTWVKTKNHSVMLVKKKPYEDPVQQIELIRDLVSEVKPVKLIKSPKQVNEDLLTFYPIVDAHVGMRAWGEEVGEDYDTDIAVKYITEGIAECIDGSPSSNVGIIMGGGDITHADDNNSETPQSKHPLDVDGRHDRTIKTVIDMCISMVEMAAQKHEKVIFRCIRGNHDKNTYKIFNYALYQRYHNNPRIFIDTSPSDFFIHQFGKVMIAAHHGDKASATNLVLQAADKWPEIWGQTRHRYYYMAHKHHKEFKDIGGMSCEMLRAATKPDSYSDSHSFTGKSQLRAITYHREKGECARKIVNY